MLPDPNTMTTTANDAADGWLSAMLSLAPIELDAGGSPAAVW